jgi:bisphosphoglycerate-independent phosphoglycerate mutase (AlkP superfamily)
MNEIITLMINPVAKISSVAPTIVKSLGITVPEQMKGKILDKELL